jgi:hypothetical protein
MDSPCRPKTIGHVHYKGGQGSSSTFILVVKIITSIQSPIEVLGFISQKNSEPTELEEIQKIQKNRTGIRSKFE